MRVGVMWGVALPVVLSLAPAVGADIFLYRDRLGVLHLTNAPTEGPSRLVIKERARPPEPSRPVSKTAPPDVFVHPRASAATSIYDGLIRRVAARHDIEYALVKAVIKAESDFDRLAVSPKGALGLMQLMPQTAAQHSVRDVFHPRENIEGGCRHLRMLLDRYGGSIPLALAAYNAGIQRVEDAGGVPPILETREYLARVLRYRLAYMRESASVLQARR